MIAAGLVLTAFLMMIAVIDALTYRIPDALSLPLVAIGLAWNAYAGETMMPYLIGAGVGYSTLAAFGSAYHAVRGRDGLGLGDAKLFAAGGAWLGWAALPIVLLVASISALLYLVTARLLMRRALDERLAWGPWLAASIWLVWAIRAVRGSV